MHGWYRGLTAKQGRRLAENGWLRRLGRGLYLRPGDELNREATMAWLGTQVPGLHVAGKTALGWRGVRRKLAFKERLVLRGDVPARLPVWLTTAFSVTYQATYLFEDSLPPGLGLAPLPGRRSDVLVSVPERAMLELLTTSMYDQPHQFESLLPSSACQEPLLAKAHDLALSASGLAGQTLASELRGLLRAMNSYYSNRIEGQHTRPLELEQALRKDFSQDAKLAARQRLAIAHIDAEIELEARFSGVAGAGELYSVQAVMGIHGALFSRLPPSDLQTDQGAPIEPGVLRAQEVSVGRHVAPMAASLGMFLDRWATFYGGVRRGDAAPVAVAAAHQRLGWVHPFVDGNGRVIRLHTHTLLSALGYTGGMWSPLRGFARSVDRYHALLAAADEPRRGDLDGRGNLSESALVDWIDYVLDVCIDQVSFMCSMLNLGAIEQRIAACLSFEQESIKSGVRLEALRPLHYLFVTGLEIERGEFKRMTGLGTARP